MIDIVGVLGSLFPVLNSHPWAMAALIGTVAIAAAMWLAPRIIVATESLINIRSRLKDPDDWASEDSFLRTSDPALWRQNLVFNRLRLDYVHSRRLNVRISQKEFSYWNLLPVLGVWAALTLSDRLLSTGSGSSSPAQFDSTSIAQVVRLVNLSAVLAMCAAVIVIYVSRLTESEETRRRNVLQKCMQDLGFDAGLSVFVVKCWYHFAIEHRDPPIALDERRTRTGVLLSFRVEHHDDDSVLLKDEYMGAMNDRRQVKCPTCGKWVWSYSRSWLLLKWLRWSKGRAKNNGTWTEQDVKLALGALSNLFSAQNVEKYLRRHESSLEHGGSAEADAGGLEGAGDEDGAAGNGWFSRALRRQRYRRQSRPR